MQACNHYKKTKPLKMKIKMPAARMLAAITLGLLGCDWFSKKKTTVSLTGTWKVTGIADSSAAGAKGKSFLHDFNAGSGDATVTFNADSSLLVTSAGTPAIDTAEYFTDTAKTKIFVRAETGLTYDTFAIKALSDTLLLVVTDSIYIQLKKQP
jgi:hypothetical protein